MIRGTLEVDGVAVSGVVAGQPSVESATLTVAVRDDLYTGALEALRAHEGGRFVWRTPRPGATEVTGPVLAIEETDEQDAEGNRFVVLRVGHAGPLRFVRS